MRARKIAMFGVIAVVITATIVFVVYRKRAVENAEVQLITDRIAAAIAAGDRSALEAEPTLQNRDTTIDWLIAKKVDLAGGYRVRVQRNGENGYQLMDTSIVTHVGVIEIGNGEVSLGFRRDPETAKLEFVTCAATSWITSSSNDAGGEIRIGSRGD